MSVYEFRKFSLDVGERCMKRNGRPLSIPDKLFDILTLLIENSARVVTKEELMLKIWGEAAVEDSNLTVSISRIRKILNEREPQRKFILTFPRRGYRFVASVRRVNPIAVLPTSHYASDMQIKKTRRAHHRDFRQCDEAYKLYLRGRFHWNKRSEEHLKKSVYYFRQAIKADSSYALAYAGLADSYNVLGFYSMSPPRIAFVRAKATATKALAIDPALAEAHASLGFTKLHHDWDVEAAEECFKQSVQLNADQVAVHLFYGCQLCAAGRFDEAIAEYERALEIDPVSLIANAALGYGYYFGRRYNEAIGQCKKTLELDSNFEVAHLWLGWSYESIGRLSEAIEEYETALVQSGGQTSILAALGRAFALGGQRNRAQQILHELRKQEKERYVSPYQVGCVYAALGETEKTVEYLEKAYVDRSHLLINLHVDPKLDSLRSDNRIGDLVERIAT